MHNYLKLFTLMPRKSFYDLCVFEFLEHQNNKNYKTFMCLGRPIEESMANCPSSDLIKDFNETLPMLQSINDDHAFPEDSEDCIDNILAPILGLVRVWREHDPCENCLANAEAARFHFCQEWLQSLVNGQVAPHRQSHHIFTAVSIILGCYEDFKENFDCIDLLNLMNLPE